MPSPTEQTTRPAPPAPVELTATYTSPQQTSSACKTGNTPLILTAPLSQPLPASSPASVAEKTAYLSSLRGAVVNMQERINVELTARMAEEGSANGNNGDSAVAGKKAKKAGKAAEQRSNSGKGKLAAVAATIVDEDAEEENYGEEIVNDDE
ncbi:hypothetical protein SLS62_005115 [Diatrype stigma]|uniref:EKC/KEOPS complex subunit GON7 n=1 Tax=Diatrype stigma TaxID=117547 RepID=A0AAN9UT85_9PEZI